MTLLEWKVVAGSKAHFLFSHIAVLHRTWLSLSPFLLSENQLHSFLDSHMTYAYPIMNPPRGAVEK